MALGPSGTGKTEPALGLGLGACRNGHGVAFATATALAHELITARDERRPRTPQKHLDTVKPLIVDELGHAGHGGAALNGSSRGSASAINVAPRWSRQPAIR